MGDLIEAFALTFLGTPGNAVRLLASPYEGGEFPVLVSTPLGEFGGATLTEAMGKALDAALTTSVDDGIEPAVDDGIEL